MTNSITSCQANALLALQRDLMGSGLTVTVGECETSCTTPAAATRVGTRTRKAATRATTADTTPRSVADDRRRTQLRPRLPRPGRGR